MRKTDKTRLHSSTIGRFLLRSSPRQLGAGGNPSARSPADLWPVRQPA